MKEERGFQATWQEMRQRYYRQARCKFQEADDLVTAEAETVVASLRNCSSAVQTLVLTHYQRTRDALAHLDAHHAQVLGMAWRGVDDLTAQLNQINSFVYSKVRKNIGSMRWLKSTASMSCNARAKPAPRSWESTIAT